ncbi:MAG: class I SAM-dependent methyltransferase, partial [Candidatus Binataceae bacterium]
MSGTDKLFAGSIPEFYERLMVPLMFEPYARDLAARLSGTGAREFLELAAGTGVVTRALASQLALDGRIVATDLNQSMLDHAKTRLADKRVTWRQADAQALPFDDESFDALACQFGVMFFPDKVHAYKEARRVLKPGGRYVFNSWDQIADNE